MPVYTSSGPLGVQVECHRSGAMGFVVPMLVRLSPSTSLDRFDLVLVKTMPLVSLIGSPITIRTL